MVRANQFSEPQCRLKRAYDHVFRAETAALRRKPVQLQIAGQGENFKAIRMTVNDVKRTDPNRSRSAKNGDALASHD